VIVFFWALIRFGKSDNPTVWVVFGLILAVASLAKPHAFFVVPALVVFIFLWTRATKENYLLSALLRIGSFSAALVGAKLGLGYLLSGPKGLSIFGSYGDLGSAGQVATTTLSQNAGFDVIGTTWGQTLMITMIIGVALPVSIFGFLELVKRDALVAEANRVRAVVGISLLNMMAVIAVFEAWQNLDTWMHTRYYSYLIPLAVVALVEAYSRARASKNVLWQRIVVGVFLILATVALVTAAVPYGANWIDAPDFRFHIDNLVLSSVLILVSISLAIWWLWDSKKPMLIALVVALVAAVFSGTHISNYLVTNFGQETAYDQIARVLRNYLPQDELDKTVLIGSDAVGLQRALFGSLSGGATPMGAVEGGFDLADLPEGTRWVMSVGEATVNGVSSPVLSGVGYNLYPVGDSSVAEPRYTDSFSTSSPCSSPENEGWLCGNSVDIKLASASATGANMDVVLEFSEEASLAELEFILGDAVLAGTPPGGAFSLTLNFANTLPSDLLTIRVKDGSLPASANEARFVRVISVIQIK
jgi:phosphoglycerol transferase